MVMVLGDALSESEVTVRVTVPARVPVRSGMLVAVEPAGIVKLIAREPFENRTISSVPPTEDANDSVSVPARSTEGAVSTLIAADGCCADVALSRRPTC